MTNTVPLRTRLDDEEMTALKELAKLEDRSVCSVVRVAVREYINTKKNPR